MYKGRKRVRIFSALEVANICGVVNQTAINWIRNGYLKAFTTPGGQYRIYAKDLAAFLDTRGMSSSGEVLQIVAENANWDVLLIASPAPMNEKLKNEIANSLPGYSIVQAFDWFDIGRKMTVEKPGFILLDTELEGVEISRFIQIAKGDPTFGNPYIFILNNDNAHYEADLLLTKPFNLEQFLSAIRSFEKQVDIAANA